MEPTYWQERWKQGRIGFHEARPNPWLVEHLGVLGIAPATRRVLVPLCGKSVDLSYLASRGAEVVGVELVEDAARAFFDEAGITPARTVDGAWVRYEAAGVEILVADFLALEPADVGVFDAYFDRASIVALPPGLRESYAQALRRLTPTGRGLVVTFEHDATDGQPPFSVTAHDLVALFPERVFEELGASDALTPGGLLAQRGATFARDVAFAVAPEL